MLVLRVSRPTPTLCSITVIQRRKGHDAVRGYLQPTAEEWDSADWAPIRALCHVEVQDPQPEPRV
jgi:hypothetical protein